MAVASGGRFGSTVAVGEGVADGTNVAVGVLAGMRVGVGAGVVATEQAVTIRMSVRSVIDLCILLLCGVACNQMSMITKMLRKQIVI